jgi:hypothetical protein
MLKKLHFLISYDVILLCICAQKKSHNVLKNANIFKKWLKWFLFFMKFVIFTKHCDSIWLNKFVSHVKSLIMIVLQMDIF